MSFEKLLDKINSLTWEILVKALGDNPKGVEWEKLIRYWMELELEVERDLELERGLEPEIESPVTECQFSAMETGTQGGRERTNGARSEIDRLRGVEEMRLDMGCKGCKGYSYYGM